MQCPSCDRKEIPKNSRFCPQCGCPLQVKPVIDFSTYIAERTHDFTGREWVFKAVDDWLGDPKGPPLFVLIGEPGCGKTAIASRIYQISQGHVPAPDGLTHLSRNFLSAVHFCSARDHRWINPHIFSESLASQLSRYQAFAVALLTSAERENYEHRRPIQVVHQTVEQVKDHGRAIAFLNIIERIEVGGVPAEDAFVRVVREPLEFLAREESGQLVVILVDALDEALLYGGKMNIVDLLTHAENLPVSVRFIVTTRPKSEVLRPLKRGGPRECWLTQDEGLERSLNDVKSHVLYVLSQRGDLSDRLTPRLSPETFADALRDKSDGNFLYVSNILEMLAARQDKIDTESLGEIPTGLGAVYLESLERLFGRDGSVWQERYAPLLGTLTIAKEALTEQQIAALAGIEKPQVRKDLKSLRSFLDVDERVAASQRRYVLYHRSFADFLLDEDQAEEYWLEEQSQHDRVIRHYATRFKDSREECDSYGLRHMVSHMLARLDLEKNRREQNRLSEELYLLVLDEEFRKKQREVLGDLGPTLGDLEATIDLTLSRDDLIKTLACSGAYRNTIRSQGIADAVFVAVDNDDLALALKRAEFCSGTPDWSRILFLCLAWEGALKGDPDTTHQAVVQAKGQPLIQTLGLCTALLSHIARILSQEVRAPREAEDWFGELDPDGDVNEALQRYGPAEPVEPLRQAELRLELDKRLSEMEQLAREGAAEGVSMVMFLLDDEVRAYQAAELEDLLIEFAADPLGQNFIDRALEPILPNPYPRYRDIALTAIGIAVLAVSKPEWVRQRLRRIINTGLNQEGVSFTFDLPSILAAEAERRHRATPELSQYCNQALHCVDRWGTQVRALSANAAALFWQHRKAEAFDTLDKAAQIPPGFSGFATITLLSLANRWVEFGRPAGSAEKIELLVEAAAEQACNVRDYGFRLEMQALVDAYRTWQVQDALDFQAVESKLAKTPDRATRRIYRDYASALWASSDKPNSDALKALVRDTLADGTQLDSILGRLVGLRVQELRDDELDEAVRICTSSLTSGRPWELGQWR